LRQDGGRHEAHQHEGEIFGGAEAEGDLGERRPDEGDEERADRAGEERADRRDGEGRAGAALTRHLVAVDAGDDGARLAG
jgi:hypothetical protein